MISFENYYLQCPCCKSWLTGKQVLLETISQSLLYSDGLIISNSIPLNKQIIVLCPACAVYFWPHKQSPVKDEALLMGFHSYPWSSWYLFGCNLLSHPGRVALVKHYWYVLQKIGSLDEKQEIVIRKSLLWAYNDLYRDSIGFSIKEIYDGRLSFRSWFRLKLLHRKNLKFYESEQSGFQDNLLRLIELTENMPEPDPAELAELYREAGDFKKAAEAISSIKRRTHFITSLINYIQKGERRVFKVAG